MWMVNGVWLEWQGQGRRSSSPIKVIIGKR